MARHVSNSRYHGLKWETGNEFSWFCDFGILNGRGGACEDSAGEEAVSSDPLRPIARPAASVSHRHNPDVIRPANIEQCKREVLQSQLLHIGNVAE